MNERDPTRDFLSLLARLLARHHAARHCSAAGAQHPPPSPNPPAPQLDVTGCEQGDDNPPPDLPNITGRLGEKPP